MAALDEARLRNLQATRRATTRPSRDPVQHRRSPARNGQHDRHDRPRRDDQTDIRDWIRHPRRHRKADLAATHTSFTHEARGYVSTAFPTPSANFPPPPEPPTTADHDFLLTHAPTCRPRATT